LSGLSAAGALAPGAALRSFREERGCVRHEGLVRALLYVDARNGPSCLHAVENCPSRGGSFFPSVKPVLAPDP